MFILTAVASLVICDHRDLLSEFRSTLSDWKSESPLVLLVDGVDHVQDGRGQLSSDWIPQQLPQVGYVKGKHTSILSASCTIRPEMLLLQLSKIIISSSGRTLVALSVCL